MRLYNMVGYKLFKQNEEDGSVHMIRIIGMHRPYKITPSTKDPAEIFILDYKDNQKKKVRVDSLKEYSPLKPDGIATFSVVNIRDNEGKICKDVIVTGSKFLNIELKISNVPYAVCRQNITDVFYNLLSRGENDTLVGMSVNMDTCPSNFDFRMMFAADSIVYSEFINFYRLDSLDDILRMVNIKTYDEVLSDLYSRHISYIKRPELLFKSEHGGWCKNLRTLLEQNNFMSDINQMLGITQVEFDVKDYLVNVSKDDITYQIVSDDFRLWLSSIYKVNMTEVAVMKFDHDINLADFNDNRYLLIKDNTGILYLMVYTVEGEFFEADLEEKAKEMDFSSKFKLSFEASKYATDNK